MEAVVWSIGWVRVGAGGGGGAGEGGGGGGGGGGGAFFNLSSKGGSVGFVLEEIKKSKVSSLPLPATKETKEMEEMKHEAKK